MSRWSRHPFAECSRLWWPVRRSCLVSLLYRPAGIVSDGADHFTASIVDMSRPPAAREAVLDAFERLIIADGERAATLEATARAAGVSKGGLLYHFASREALIAGVLERLRLLVDEDIALIESAPDGPISYFVRSSVALSSPLDHAFVATVRLAQGGNREAARAIDEVRDRWLDVIGRHVD